LFCQAPKDLRQTKKSGTMKAGYATCGCSG